MRQSVLASIALAASLVLISVAVRLANLARDEARAADCEGQLTQYGLALSNYESAFGHFPPAYTRDLSGNPIQSWRVAILHIWKGHDLCGRFDFNVRWNHPNNASLRDYDTPAYFWWCPCGSGRATRMTDYVAVVGGQTAWPGSRALRRSEITDDPASTILVLEVPDSGIHWMEPRDPTLDEILASGLSSHHPGYVNALFADGRVRKVRTDVSREALKALLTVGGGETLDASAWKWKAP